MTTATLSSTRPTLSSTVCVASRTCAVTIRTSSFVSLSSLFNASSISVFPISLFIYFSEKFINQQRPGCTGILTHTTLLYLLRSHPKNGKHLDHNLYNNIYQFRWRRHPSVDFKALEECLHALEDVDESVLACANIYGCLRWYYNGPHEGRTKDTH